MKTKHHYLDSPSSQMKDRIEYILQEMEARAQWGVRLDYIHPDVLKQLKKKNLIRIERSSRGIKTSISVAKSTREIKVEEKRVPEPYKKRRAAMKEAGLKFRKSQ